MFLILVANESGIPFVGQFIILNQVGSEPPIPSGVIKRGKLGNPLDMGFQ